MKHNLTIHVSKKPKDGGIIACKTVTLRERFLRFLVGDLKKVTILVPGDSVDAVAIKESPGGDDGGN